MSALALIQVTLLFIFSLITFAGLGTRIMAIFEKLLLTKQSDRLEIEEVGINLAVGTVVYGYLSLSLGWLNQFTRNNLLILLAVCFIWGVPKIKLPKLSFKFDLLAVVTLMVAAFMLLTVYLAAMQPPYTSDELNYHMPQAQRIVDSHRLDLKFGGHYFYGNIPKLMEVILAAGVALSGYSYAHSLHFVFYVALLFIVFGLMKKEYDLRTAAFAVFLLLMYDDLTWNVTSGFVDGAAFTLEMSALLLAIYYRKAKNIKVTFVQIGLLLGAGLSIKYSAGFTALYVALITLPYYQSWLYLILPAVLMGGFWYGKNLLWFGNPFYPLYFGHKGVSNEEYNSLIANIQEFGARTPASFLKLLSYFRQIPRLPVYTALILAPVSLLVKDKRRSTALLVGYLVLYLLYWFFLGTHQLRFIAPGAMAALILLAITLAKVNGKLLLTGLLIIAVYAGKTPYFDQTVGSYFWSTKFHLTERQYALGNLTQDEFLYRWYGCYYSAVEYMNTVEGDGDVADIWSQNVDFNVPFYATRHAFVYGLEPANYLYVRQSAKDQFTARFPENAKKIREYENEFINKAELSWSKDDCQIYRLK